MTCFYRLLFVKRAAKLSYPFAIILFLSAIAHGSPSTVNAIRPKLFERK